MDDNHDMCYISLLRPYDSKRHNGKHISVVPSCYMVSGNIQNKMPYKAL